MDESEVKEKKKKVRKGYSVILTPRDLEILEFILDMKFASIEDIFEKFFKVTLAGEEAKSNEWAVRRLQQLAKAGYLKGVHSFSERTKFYLATIKAYQEVSRNKPEEEVLKPSRVIDHRTFDHDRLVLEARIMLENKRAASCWVSDKKLRSSTELSGGLTLSNVPDGIYKSENGQKVAFEIELSKKSPKEIISKIKRYVSMMRSENSKVRVFDRVVYVCAKKYSYDLLVRETKIYGDLFEVMTFAGFFGQGNSYEPQG
ncbi:replication-relaxation family protein [Bdellovibrio bacteriovorus]|uniref:replication-relaxation family protein n=1 Tax=Bdellovibrio bacteriovorus TaxID=959 RepID=UPI003AA8153B